MKKFFAKIPQLLSSQVSIFIYLFLFLYLVIWGGLCLFIKPLDDLAPSSDIQLILGNYTNVLSALGASIAAGTGVVAHHRLQSLHRKHDDLAASLKDLHEKFDQLTLKNKD